jgi:hypothetical protein
MRLRRLLSGALAGVAVAGCGGVPDAPATSILPVAPQANVIASAAGSSQVDPAHDRNHYRYLAVSGTGRMAGPRLIAAEVRSMLGRGWNRERSIGFRGTASVAQTVPVTSPGAEVLLDSPDRKEYAALQLVANRTAAEVQTSRTPLWHNPAIATALRDHRAVLWVVLGNGSHS